MKHRWNWVAVALLATTVAWWAFSRSALAADARGQTPWEYKVIELNFDPSEWEADLNKAGAEGWEAVTIVPRLLKGESIENRVVLKRPAATKLK